MRGAIRRVETAIIRLKYIENYHPDQETRLIIDELEKTKDKMITKMEKRDKEITKQFNNRVR
jgi:hypothetical protein